MKMDPLWVFFHFWGWGVRTWFAGAPSVWLAKRDGTLGAILREFYINPVNFTI